MKKSIPIYSEFLKWCGTEGKEINVIHFSEHTKTIQKRIKCVIIRYICHLSIVLRMQREILETYAENICITRYKTNNKLRAHNPERNFQLNYPGRSKYTCTCNTGLLEEFRTIELDSYFVSSFGLITLD